MHHSPESGLHVRRGDGIAAADGLILLPHLRAGRGNGAVGSEHDGVEEEGDLVKAAGLGDKLRDTGVVEHVLVRVDGASSVNLTYIERLVEVEAPNTLIEVRDIEELNCSVDQCQKLWAIGQLQIRGDLLGAEPSRKVGNTGWLRRRRSVRACEIV